MSDSKRQKIDDKICLLMEIYGPDGHIDGHDKITDYICEILEEENKSLRESIADLQSTIEFYSKVENFGTTVWEDETKDGRCWLEPAKEHGLTEIYGECSTGDFGIEATEALERLKARGHWVEEKK